MSVFGEEFLGQFKDSDSDDDIEIFLKKTKKKKIVKKKKKKRKREEPIPIPPPEKPKKRKLETKPKIRAIPLKPKVKDDSGIPIVDAGTKFKAPKVFDATDVLKQADVRTRSKMKETKALTPEEKKQLEEREAAWEKYKFFKVEDIIEELAGEKLEGSDKWKWKQKQRAKLGLKRKKTKMPYPRLKKVNARLRARGDMAKAEASDKVKELKSGAFYKNGVAKMSKTKLKQVQRQMKRKETMSVLSFFQKKKKGGRGGR